MTSGPRLWRWAALGVLGVCAASCDNQRLSAPALLRPAQGEATGSVWAARSVAPLFQWAPVAGATSYELQVDDSCAAPAGCLFPSPEIAVIVPQSQYQAPALAVATTSPVGARYFWRVRACGASDCGSWSATFYADVGRQRQDFNGDGYADLAIAASGAVAPSGVFVYFGGTTFAATAAPDWMVAAADGYPVGYQATWLGDVDGDGFAELAFLAQRPTDASQGSLDVARIYRGGLSPDATAAQEVSADAIYFLRPAGDVNGDGFRDLYLSEDVAGQAIHFIHLGSAALSPFGTGVQAGVYSDPGRLLGTTDLNDDGALDLIFERIGATTRDVIWGSVGAAPFQPVEAAFLNLEASDLKFFAKDVVDPTGASTIGLEMSDPSASASPATPFVLQTLSAHGAPMSSPCDGALPTPPGGLAEITGSAAVGDTDGDGYDDFVLGDGATVANRTVLYYGGCPVTRVLVLPGRDAAQGGGFGGTSAHPATGAAVAAAGDLNGDGYPDFAVGNPYSTEDGPGTGEVYLYFGGPTLNPAPDFVLTNPANVSGSPDGFGQFLD